nr:pollen-specific leucine-rich repeat extensin-like protein 2 [Odocoileus virginianus texanus]
MFRPFGRCALAPPCAPRVLLAKSYSPWPPPTPPSRAKPTSPVSESSAFSVPPEDLVAPAPYTSPTGPTPSSPVPAPSSPTSAPLSPAAPSPTSAPLSPVAPSPTSAPLSPAAPSPTSAPVAAPTTPPHTSSVDTQPTETIHSPPTPILYPPLPTLTPSPSPVSSHTRSHGQSSRNSFPCAPAPLLPLRQVAGAKGLAQVHVPFSLPDLSQIEAKLGSFSSNPTHYIKQFTQLTCSYALTWKDIYVVLRSTTTLEERQAIWTAARAQADQRHFANPSPKRPPGAEAVPDTDPDWDYQETGGGELRVRYMVECLLDGMEATSNKVVNFLKLDEIPQGPDENPAMFWNRLTEALSSIPDWPQTPHPEQSPWPVLIHLKDPTCFLAQPQFPLSQSNLRGLKPIIDRLLGQGLLVPTHVTPPSFRSVRPQGPTD